MNSKYAVLLRGVSIGNEQAVDVIKNVVGVEVDNNFSSPKIIRLYDSNDEAQRVAQLLETQGCIAAVIEMKAQSTTVTTSGVRMSFDGREPKITTFGTMPESVDGIPSQMGGSTYTEEIHRTPNGYTKTVRQRVSTGTNGPLDMEGFMERAKMKRDEIFSGSRCPMCGGSDVEDISKKFFISLSNKMRGKNIKYSCRYCSTRW